MKQSTYKLLTALACGTFAVFAAIWLIAAVMCGNQLAAIALGLLSVFLVTACRIQLHDREVALRKEDWRREPTKLIEDWRNGL